MLVTLTKVKIKTGHRAEPQLGIYSHRHKGSQVQAINH